MPIQGSRTDTSPSDMAAAQKAPWPLRFEPGEREARRAAGEWLGTNLAYARVANDAEKWLRKPVFASGPVIYWSALRRMGIKDQFPGFGSLTEFH